MKRIILLFPLLGLISSCKNSDKKAEPKVSAQAKVSKEKYLVDDNKLSKDFETWYNYTYHNIRLSTNFIGLDIDSSKIDKRTFLNQLSSGNFIAYKIAKEKNVPVYKLYHLKNHSPDIQNTVVEMAKTAITLLNMEGKELPEYDFTDLNGKQYSKNIAKGKVLVIKCWFIRCVACVKEFPDLNKLVNQYENRSDIQFISLASDAKQDLITFLSKKSFNYAVVANMDDYMTNKLRVNAYPLHLLIDRQGKIVKATNSIDDLIPSLEIEMGNS